MMGWPQITIIALLALNLGAHMAKNGQPRTGNYSFFATLISTAIVVWVYYMGGFFS